MGQALKKNEVVAIVKPQHPMLQEEFFNYINKLESDFQMPFANFRMRSTGSNLNRSSLDFSVRRCGCGAIEYQTEASSYNEDAKEHLKLRELREEELNKMNASNVDEDMIKTMQRSIKSDFEKYNRPKRIILCVREHTDICPNKSKLECNTNELINREYEYGVITNDYWNKNIYNVHQKLLNAVILRVINGDVYIQRYEMRLSGNSFKDDLIFDCVGEMKVSANGVEYAVVGEFKKGKGIHYKSPRNIDKAIEDIMKSSSSSILSFNYVEPGVLLSVPFERTGLKEYLAEQNRRYNMEDVVELEKQGGSKYTWMTMRVKEYPATANKIIGDYLKMYCQNPLIEQYVKAEMIGYINYMKKENELSRLKSLKEEFRFNKGILREIKKLRWLNYDSTTQNVLFVKELSKLAEEGIDMSLEFFKELVKEDMVDLRKLYNLLCKYNYKINDIYSYLQHAWTTQALMPKEVIETLHDVARMSNLAEIEVNKFPRSLVMTHDVLMRDFKYVQNEVLNREYLTIVDDLTKRFSFENDEFIIRVPQQLNEILKEGSELKHCVASYADAVASGETIVLFLRRKNYPNVSFMTIEIRDEVVKQLKGFKNRPLTDFKALRFISDWKKAKKLY